jgi:hypothetical protein
VGTGHLCSRRGNPVMVQRGGVLDRQVGSYLLRIFGRVSTFVHHRNDQRMGLNCGRSGGVDELFLHERPALGVSGASGRIHAGCRGHVLGREDVASWVSACRLLSCCSTAAPTSSLLIVAMRGDDETDGVLMLIRRSECPGVTLAETALLTRSALTSALPCAGPVDGLCRPDDNTDGIGSANVDAPHVPMVMVWFESAAAGLLLGAMGLCTMSIYRVTSAAFASCIDARAGGCFPALAPGRHVSTPRCKDPRGVKLPC